MVEYGQYLEQYQLVWNELELDYKLLSEKEAYIWSSSTLYPEPVRQERKKCFKE